jgi:hypothetical protein
MYFVIGHPMVVIQEQIDIAVDIGQIVDPSGNSRPTAMSPTPPRKRPRRRSPSSCPNAKHTANTDSGHEIHKATFPRWLIPEAQFAPIWRSRQG